MVQLTYVKETKKMYNRALVITRTPEEQYVIKASVSKGVANPINAAVFLNQILRGKVEKLRKKEEISEKEQKRCIKYLK